eukprot:Sspe_Gene.67274::Locus_39715_Transcript_1_1_Confidence_1.000_Length_3065::g.67274::m.67274
MAETRCGTEGLAALRSSCVRLPFLLLLLLAPLPAVADLKSDIQSLIDSFSYQWGGHAVVVSYRNSTASFDLVTGYRDFRSASPTPAQSTDMFLFGSLTKLYTAVSILKLVDENRIALDDPAHMYIDPVLRVSNKTTLSEIFGAAANNITIRHLLSMRGGLREYDTLDLRTWQHTHPLEDFTPLDVLHYIPDKSLRCPPGTCGAYTSIHFTLLGFVLLNASGETQWDKYDQRDGLPHADRYPRTIFPRRGTLQSYDSVDQPVVHGYEQNGWYDVYYMSALGGWTCGNMLASPPDTAQFLFDLFARRTVISSHLVDEMLDFQYLDKSVFWLGNYGLGVQELPQGTMSTGRYYGHGGETYGFETSGGYNEKLNFSLTVASNMEAASGWHLGTLHTQIYKLLVQDGCGTECADRVQLNCSDAVGFVDEGGAKCDEWAGLNCRTAVEEYDYTVQGRDMLVANCPVSCKDVSCPAEGTLKPFAVQHFGSGYYFHARMTQRVFHGQYLEKTGGGVDKCIEACDRNPRCNSFVVNGEGASMTCWLKEQCTYPNEPLVPAGPQGNDQTVEWKVYFKPCLTDDGYWWATEEVSGDGIAVTFPSEQGCREECARREDCKSFTTSPLPGGNVQCTFRSACVDVDHLTSLPFRRLGGVAEWEGLCVGSCQGYPLPGTVEQCAAMCEATKPRMMAGSTCRSFSYLNGACFLKNACIDENTTRAGPAAPKALQGWQTYYRPCEFKQLPYHKCVEKEVESMPMYSAGHCLDWCREHSLVSQGDCHAVNFEPLSKRCGILLSRNCSASSVTDGVTMLFVREDTLPRTFWRDCSPRGCCVTETGMYENSTEAVCALKAVRRVFHPGMSCPANTLDGKTPSPSNSTPSPTHNETSPPPSPLPTEPKVPQASPAPPTAVPKTGPSSGAQGDKNEARGEDDQGKPLVFVLLVVIAVLSALIVGLLWSNWMYRRALAAERKGSDVNNVELVDKTNQETYAPALEVS